MSRPPMVTVVGRKHSGKTTLVVALARELRRRGHRVMTIKHGAHTFSMDPEGTDTWRHFHEGEADATVMIAPDKLSLVKRWSEELSPEAVAEQYLGDADVVVCEGFGRTELPRIELFRRAAHAEPLWRADDPQADRWLAIVTDDDAFEAAPMVLRLSEPTWFEKAASIVETRVIWVAGREGRA